MSSDADSDEDCSYRAPIQPPTSAGSGGAHSAAGDSSNAVDRHLMDVTD